MMNSCFFNAVVDVVVSTIKFQPAVGKSINVGQIRWSDLLPKKEGHFCDFPTNRRLYSCTPLTIWKYCLQETSRPLSEDQSELHQLIQLSISKACNTHTCLQITGAITFARTLPQMRCCLRGTGRNPSSLFSHQLNHWVTMALSSSLFQI